MHELNIAELVEFSEARAYASLAQLFAPGPEADCDVRLVAIGSAVALVAPGVRTTLNLNRVIGLGIKEPVDEAAIDAIGRLYECLDLSYGIEIGPCAEPHDLRAWLRQRRMRRTQPTAMRYRAASLMKSETRGLNVAKARDASESQLVGEICSSVFRMPASVCSLLAATRRDARWRQWLVRRGATPIAAALSFVDQGVAWLGWDATLPEFRGLGAHRAMIAARVHDAWEAGCAHVTTETGVNTTATPNPSGRNYEKEAFRLAYERMTYAAIHRSADTLPRQS